MFVSASISGGATPPPDKRADTISTQPESRRRCGRAVAGSWTNQQHLHTFPHLTFADTSAGAGGGQFRTITGTSGHK